MLNRYKRNYGNEEVIILRADQREEFRTYDWSNVRAVIVGLLMPKPSGEDVIRWLRKNHPDMHIVVSTGVRPEDVPYFVQAEADVILYKPYGMNVLRDAIGLPEKS